MWFDYFYLYPFTDEVDLKNEKWKMKNLFPLTLLFVFLTHKNIILINEEFLILLSFITFIILVVKNIGTSIGENFKVESNEINNNLRKSLEEVLFHLKKHIGIQKSFNKLFFSYKSLSDYLYKISSISNLLIKNKNEVNKNKNFNRQLAFIKKVEDQTLKLFTLILLEKIQKVSSLRRFHENRFNFKYFQTIKKIKIRESINKI